MSYSINIELRPANKNGEQKVMILVIIDGKKLPRIDTLVKLKDGLKKADTVSLNIINKKRNEVEQKILKSIQLTGRPSLPSTNIENLLGFWEDRKKDIARSTNRIRAIEVALDAIGDCKLASINTRELESIEKKLREREKPLSESTIWSYMSRLKAVLNLAIRDHILQDRQISGYRWPAYYSDVPIFLLEPEIEAFAKALSGIADPSLQQAGYRFLLACYAGYRISDAKRFNPDFINGDALTIRAAKNKKVVSIAIHNNLRPVVDWLLKNPECNLTDQAINKLIKDIAKAGGIKKHIKFHTGRHSFAMLLTRKGFTIEEVAEFLGDDIRAAKTYARLWNDELNRKVIEKLG